MPWYDFVPYGQRKHWTEGVAGFFHPISSATRTRPHPLLPAGNYESAKTIAGLSYSYSHATKHFDQAGTAYTNLATDLICCDLQLPSRHQAQTGHP